MHLKLLKKYNLSFFLFGFLYVFCQAGTSPSNIIYIPPFLNFIALAAFLIFLLINIKINNLIYIKKDIFLYLIPFFLLFLSLILSINYLFIILYILISFFLVSSINTENLSLHTFEKSIFLGVLLSWLAILYNFHGVSRYSGFFNNPNAFGFYAVSLLYFTVFLNKSKISIFIIISSIIFIMLSGSRTALVGLILFILLFQSKKNILLCTITITSILIYYHITTSFDFFELIRFAESAEKLTSGRSVIFNEIINEKRNQIFLFENVNKYVYLVKSNNFHNSFLKIYSFSGLIYLLIYLIVLTYCILIIKNRKLKKILVVFYILNLFEDYLFSINGIYFYSVVLLFIISRCNYDAILYNQNNKLSSRK